MTFAQRVSMCFAAICALFSLSAQAADEVCPAKVELASAQLSGVPAPWQPVAAKTSAWLSGVSAFDGPPEEEASLVPSDFKKKNTVMVWDFRGKFARGKWISCDYGEGVARIAMKVADGVTSCTATTAIKGSPKVFSASFSCK